MSLPARTFITTEVAHASSHPARGLWSSILFRNVLSHKDVRSFKNLNSPIFAGPHNLNAYPQTPPYLRFGVLSHFFWSQKTSRLNLKPYIRLSKNDPNYKATRLHFENLVERYGNPITILNLIKTCKKKPRETILCTEFANAVRFINKGSTKEDHLRFIPLDLHKLSKNGASIVLEHLARMAAYALNLTGFFYYQVRPNCGQEDLLNFSCFK
ncbi:hypothetical protein SLA2020_032820 [Shorea laevis]